MPPLRPLRPYKVIGRLWENIPEVPLANESVYYIKHRGDQQWKSSTCNNAYITYGSQNLSHKLPLRPNFTHGFVISQINNIAHTCRKYTGNKGVFHNHNKTRVGDISCNNRSGISTRNSREAFHNHMSNAPLHNLHNDLQYNNNLNSNGKLSYNSVLGLDSSTCSSRKYISVRNSMGVSRNHKVYYTIHSGGPFQRVLRSCSTPSLGKVYRHLRSISQKASKGLQPI